MKFNFTKNLLLICLLFISLQGFALQPNIDSKEKREKIELYFDFDLKDLEEIKANNHIKFLIYSQINNVMQFSGGLFNLNERKSVPCVLGITDNMVMDHFEIVLVKKGIKEWADTHFHIKFGNPQKLFNRKYTFRFNERFDEGWQAMKNHSSLPKMGHDKVYMLTEDIK